MRYLIILFWLILGIIYFWIWNNGKANCCDEAGIAIEKPGITDTGDARILKELGLPIVFKWGSELPYRGGDFDTFRDSIIASLNDDGILEITGYFNPEEENTTDEIDLGIARAKELRKLFPGIPDDRIRLVSIATAEKPDNLEDYFVSSGFAGAIDPDLFRDTDGIPTIYFDFGSDNFTNRTEIEDFLNRVAERVKSSGEKISLTGHTDNIGSAESNIVFGQRRANVVKNYLLNQGVPDDQIITNSKGESEPIVPNTSSDNRAKNRRVELKIIK